MTTQQGCDLVICNGEALEVAIDITDGFLMERAGTQGIDVFVLMLGIIRRLVSNPPVHQVGPLSRQKGIRARNVHVKPVPKINRAISHVEIHAVTSRVLS
jgi:hypothetical protein